jgi:NAD+ synthase (glutamine-hydrolysing)
MEVLVKENPLLIINIAASPFDYSHAEKRNQILTRNAKQYNLPLIYLNHVGAQTELIFDGGSVIMNSGGETEYELKYFHEDFFIVELDGKNWKLNDRARRNNKWETSNKIERIYSALVLGIHDYFVKQNFSKAILGLSGGIDSAIVVFLAVEALGKENILPVLMPSEFSSKGSIDDSVFLCNNLGLKYKEISIENIFNEFLDSLKPHFGNLPFNLTEENIQARARAVILMALSNKFGYILLNTSNKSELAVGYGTLYGDMAGGLSVLGDVYKTEVFELARYINREKEIIPEAIINKPPSAELRADQKDSDSLPEYEILDPILYQYIEQQRGPNGLIKMGYDKALVDRILKLVNTNEYKRYQTPPILRISPKAFGSGRRLPIVGKYLS